MSCVLFEGFLQTSASFAPHRSTVFSKACWRNLNLTMTVSSSCSLFATVSVTPRGLMWGKGTQVPVYSREFTIKSETPRFRWLTSKCWNQISYHTHTDPIKGHELKKSTCWQHNKTISHIMQSKNFNWYICSVGLHHKWQIHQWQIHRWRISASAGHWCPCLLCFSCVLV